VNRGSYVSSYVSSCAVLLGGLLYLLKIADMGEVGYYRPVRAAKGPDARIAYEV
jgi:hypothetical protein